MGRSIRFKELYEGLIEEFVHGLNRPLTMEESQLLEEIVQKQTR